MKAFQELPALGITNLIRTLRGPSGYDWFRNQKPLDWCKFLLEEANELLLAVQGGAVWEIRSESGDVLFNLISLLECYGEDARLNLDAVDKQICEKITTRHPYIFGDSPDPGPKLAEQQWRESKTCEHDELLRNRTGIIFSYSINDTQFNIMHDQPKLSGKFNEIMERIFGNIPQQPVVTRVCDDQIEIFASYKGKNFIRLVASQADNQIIVHGLCETSTNPKSIYDLIATRFGSDAIDSIVITI